MNPQLAAFQQAAAVGQELSRQSIFPGTITFTDHAPIPCGRRNAAEIATLEEGFEGSRPAFFWILRSALPGDITLQPRRTKFTDEAGVEWRVVSLVDDPTDAHLRILADIPDAK